MRSLIVIAAAVSLIAGAASAQTTIRVGQTISGELSSSDPTLDDGSHYDCYNIKPPAGQRVQIDQTSDAFDSYLTVMLGTCAAPVEVLATDDDSGGGLHSRIVLNADGREWAVAVNSIAGGATGPYQLRVTALGGGGGQAAASSGGGRPAGGQERYDWDVLCKAVDTVALVGTIEGLDDDGLMAWMSDSQRLQEAVEASARAIGRSDEAILDDIGRIGAAMMNDMSISGQVGAARAECLAAL